MSDDLQRILTAAKPMTLAGVWPWRMKRIRISPPA
jgi:hypothetical protein